jgi:pimeloyl-ACP methyl ester carboxylesterase
MIVLVTVGVMRHRPHVRAPNRKRTERASDIGRRTRPLILVGHSFGGYNVRMFNKLYPSDVAGMILVDAEHPDEEVRQMELQSTFSHSVKANIEKRNRRRHFWDQVMRPINRFRCEAWSEHR